MVRVEKSRMLRKSGFVECDDPDVDGLAAV